MSKSDKAEMDDSDEDDDLTIIQTTHSRTSNALANIQNTNSSTSNQTNHESQQIPSDDIDIDTNPIIPIQQSKKGPPKKSKMVQYGLEFKMKLFRALEEHHISDDKLLSEDPMIQSEIKQSLESQINLFFADKYPKHTINGQLKPSKLRHIKYMVKQWKRERNQKATKLNFVTRKKGAIRCGGGGRKSVLDDDIQLMIYKHINQTMNGYNFNQLRSVFIEFITRSGRYTVDPNDQNHNLKYVDITDSKLNLFKKTWNLVKSQNSKTSYDVDDVMIKHFRVCCQVFVLRILLKENIQYVGHHDQVMIWYSEQSGSSYFTSFNQSASGTSSRQNARKTFTIIPSSYHMLQTDSIDFGALVTIFESKGKTFSSKYVKSLRGVGLNEGFDGKHTNYGCISSNGWQHSHNMSASVAVLKQKKKGIMTFDNWSNFGKDTFVDALIAADIFPVFNVKNASGLTGLLDLLPNRDIRREYNRIRSQTEIDHPEMCRTRNDKLRALPRAQLARAAVDAMEFIKSDASKLNSYLKFAHYLGYSASLDDLEHDADIHMKHAVNSFSQPFGAAFKCLHSLSVNPMNESAADLLSRPKRRGRKPTDIGKSTTSYSQNELSRVESVMSSEVSHDSFQSVFSSLLIKAKTCSKIAAKQIMAKMQLSDEYRGCDLSAVQKRDIYHDVMSYDFYGLALEMKDNEDGQDTNTNRNMNISDHFGTENFEKPSLSLSGVPVVDNRILTKAGTRTIRSFFVKEPEYEGKLEEQLQVSKEKDKVLQSKEQEKERKAENQRAFTKRNMGYYNTKKRALENSDQLSSLWAKHNDNPKGHKRHKKR